MPNEQQPDPRRSGSVRRAETGSTPAGRRSWQRTGGGLALAGSILLAVATWAEYLVLGPGVPLAGFVAFLVMFVASLLAFGAATFALAAFGIVGSSVGGRFALRAYGLCWIVSQGAYLTYKYFLPPSTSNFYAVLISTGFLALTFIFGFLSAIFIATSRIAWGPARWSLFLGIGVSIAAGAVFSTSDSLILLTVMETVSALGQVFVALTYWFAPGRVVWIGE